MVEKVLLFEGRGESMELFLEKRPVSGLGKYHCQASLWAQLRLMSVIMNPS